LDGDLLGLVEVDGTVVGISDGTTEGISVLTTKVTGSETTASGATTLTASTVALVTTSFKKENVNSVDGDVGTDVGVFVGSAVFPSSNGDRVGERVGVTVGAGVALGSTTIMVVTAILSVTVSARRLNLERVSPPVHLHSAVLLTPVGNPAAQPAATLSAMANKVVSLQSDGGKGETSVMLTMGIFSGSFEIVGTEDGMKLGENEGEEEDVGVKVGFPGLTLGLIDD